MHRPEKFLARVVFVLVAGHLSCSELSAQSVPGKKEAVLLKNVILRNHVSPCSLDDAFSMRVYEAFMETIDPNGLYFVMPDLDDLSGFRLRIDDELNGAGWTFVPGVLERYRAALERADRIIMGLSDRDPANSETALHFDSAARAVSRETLKARWISWLDNETLRKVCGRCRQQSDIDSVSAHAQEMWGMLRTRSHREIQRVLHHEPGFETYVSTLFLKTMAQAFDPHTDYMSSWEVQSMFADLSSEGYSFGIGFREMSNAEIVVDYLVPGGAAWKSGLLHKTDILLDVGQGEDRLNVIASSYAEIADYLDAISPEEMVTFTVRTSTGLTREVSLQKEKERREENVVRGFVLEGARKVGYIDLPGFYSNWEQPGTSASANDVASAILKMRRENIEGLILDIRFNGGGSLFEAVEMAGLFIDEGPLGYTRDRTGDVQLIRDMHRGMVYSGPLVVLMNHGSASASEFVAATLQDYHRAVLVGGTTYGKGTAQDILPLDEKMSANWTPAGIKEGPGFADVTVRRFYSPSGASIQGRGVQPDVPLPDVLETVIPGEASEPGAFHADSVGRRVDFRTLAYPPTALLKQASAARVRDDPFYALIREIEQHFEKGEPMPEERAMPSLEACVEDQEQFNTLLQKIEIARAGIQPPFTVKNPESDKFRLEVDQHMKQVNDNYLDYLSHDSDLKEAYSVINDLITNNSR